MPISSAVGKQGSPRMDHFWYALAVGAVLAVGNVFYSMVL